MYDYLIYNQLKKYGGVQKTFHMPGHKGKGEFKKLFPVADIDVTELSYSDNLADPSGVIADAQREIASILGAARSYILTEGSSLGIFAMLYAAAERGNKVIVPRNSHQSVWNACRVLGLEPVVVQGETRDGVILPPSPAEVEHIAKNDLTVAGLIIVSPDYYGNVAPLAEYSEILKKYNKILMVDGAHGAHLAFMPEREGYAGKFADIWVDGAHKNLCTLTQGAILNINDSDLFGGALGGLSLFGTTSPSYPIMASVEYGVKQLANNPAHVQKVAAEIISLRESKGISVYPSADPFKFAVDCGAGGVSADLAAAALEKKDIYCEFSDGRYLLFYLSPAADIKDVKKAIKVLRGILSSKKLAGTYRPRGEIRAQARSYSFQYALKKPAEWVAPAEAAGRMCAQNFGVAPPCIPVCVAGEMITEEALRAISGCKTFGLSGGKIKVVAK